MITRKGTKGNDVFAAHLGDELYEGDTGYDVVSYGGFMVPARIDLLDFSLNSGAALGHRYASIESFQLSRGDDIFFGTHGNDVVNGDAGNDRLEGRGGNDSLTGHSGNDVILGGDGNDSIWGGGQDDQLFGNAGNDQIWGDANNDVITGGADAGAVNFSGTSKQYYQYSSSLLIPIEQIDDYGEWVVVPKRNDVTNASVSTSINRADGDAVFALTNGYGDARDWNATIAGSKLATINLGPGGEIPANSTIIFNAGPGSPTVVFSGTEKGFPGVKAAGSNANGVITKVDYTLASVVIGDKLTGGSGSDTFVFNIGDGVDQFNDFTKGSDKIDLASTWFDGNAANGEVSAREYNGGALLLFSDKSADGFVDHNAIFLAGLSVSAVDKSFFI